MTRRRVQAVAAVLAVVGLVVVLLNATLVDRRPPGLSGLVLSSTAGNDDHLAQTLTAIDLQFSEPVDRPSVEDRFRIDPYVGGTFSWGDNDTVAIFTPATKLPPATEFTVSLAAGYMDQTGNAATHAANPFAFRTVGPPLVAASDPEDGAEAVPADTTVTLTFDRLMDTGSVESALVVSPPRAFSPAWSGPKLTVSFESPLAFGTAYTVNVGTAAADTDGSHLATPFSTSFTTVAAGLGVQATTPTDGVSGVSVRTPIAITFDGPIDPTSVNGAVQVTPPVNGTVRIADVPTETPVSASPTATAGPPAGSAGGGTVLEFTPSGPLAPHTTYTIELVPVVRSVEVPGQVAAGQTWTFTTGGPTTSAQNQIAFLTDRGGVRNVWLMNPDGSNPRQITTELAPVSEYDVAPDGRSIVYGAGGVVRQMRIDGTDVATLTPPDTFDYAPVVAPDGESVLVGRRGADGADLGWWLVPMPGGGSTTAARQLLPDGAPPLGSDDLQGDGITSGEGGRRWARSAAFDPTGRWLLIADELDRVRLVDTEAEAAAASTVMSGLEARFGPPVWDAARRAFLIAADQQGVDSAYAIAADQEPTPLYRAAGPVAVSGIGGVATLVAPAGSNLGYAPPSGGSPVAITNAPDLLDLAPAFSPDGRTILFVRVGVADPDQSAGIWLVGIDGSSLRQLSRDGTDARWLP